MRCYSTHPCLDCLSSTKKVRLCSNEQRSGMQFVSKFTENKADGQQLENVYNRVKQGKSAGKY